jgi:hypothetical protein
MPPRLRRALRRRSVLLFQAAVLAAGCGGGADPIREMRALTDTAATATVARFPPAGHRTMTDVVGSLPAGPVVESSVSILQRGRNRIGFALVDTASKQMTGATVALYVADVDGTHARGPFVARAESLDVRPAFQSRQADADRDVARGIYVTEVPFSHSGPIEVVAVAKLDGRLVASRPSLMTVGAGGSQIPRVGQPAPVIHTETAADVGGDLTKIDTRRPPIPALHDVDLARILGHKPVVLVFATPQLCTSRICAPVVDVVAQVQSETGDRVAFVHQEIYRDNDRAAGFRPQVNAYGLPTEPWTFVINRAGRVSARFEGALSVDELRHAVARVAPA